jgi:carboxynorspermidine decarboxylase
MKPLDISLVPTPAYVLEEAALKRNLALLDRVQKESGGKIILALKGFAFWSAFPWVREVLQGATASSLHEARLAKEEMRKEVHVYSVAFTDREFPEILSIADHIVFNSFGQWRRFKPQVMAARAEGRRVSCGMRVNPGHSEVKTPLYDPCYANSRLGVVSEEFRPDELDGLDGLHFHAHCGNNSDTLERVVASFEKLYGEFLPRMKWINFGGGHHITKEGYDVERLIRVIKGFRERHGIEVYVEPGEAVGWRTGPLVSSVVDIVRNGMDIAILDTSATAHMPDTLEMPHLPGGGRDRRLQFRQAIGHRGQAGVRGYDPLHDRQEHHFQWYSAAVPLHLDRKRAPAGGAGIRVRRVQAAQRLRAGAAIPRRAAPRARASADRRPAGYSLLRVARADPGFWFS